MTHIERKISDILTQQLSSIIVKGILRKAKIRNNTTEINETTFPLVLHSLHASLRIFLPEPQRSELAQQLDALKPKPIAQRIPISQESDILSAQPEISDLLQNLGANRLAFQRIMTIIMELARNIAHYTPGGSIEITPQPPASVRILAIDAGRGIKDLPSILDGKYRNNKGMGLRGIRSLSETFFVTTSEKGTRIESEVCW